MARAIIADIHKRDRTPILVGGSGYYVASVVYSDYQFSPVTVESETVVSSKHQELFSTEELQEALLALGFQRELINNSDWHNPRRLQNYLRKIKEGRSQVDTQVAKRFSAFSNYELEVHSLNPSAQDLRSRLAERVEEMFAKGLLQEVAELSLTKSELSPRISLAAGYRELLAYLDTHPDYRRVTETIPATDLELLKKQVLQSHLKLARKQIVWNKKYFANPAVVIGD
jgi:tRNA dimethylallyltransferase